jgi:hypothetical protein
MTRVPVFARGFAKDDFLKTRGEALAKVTQAVKFLFYLDSFGLKSCVCIVVNVN